MDWPYSEIASRPVANPNTILTLTLTLTWMLILDNANGLTPVLTPNLTPNYVN